MTLRALLLLFLAPMLIACGARAPLGSVLHVPEEGAYGERVLNTTVDPEVLVQINAPAHLRPRRPTTLIIYALPNGNTIAETAGRPRREGVHWRYDIQHIAAQTRLLRVAIPERNFVVAYFQAEQKSWPAWRKKHADADQRIRAMVEEVRASLVGDVDVALLGHSGGGSFQFGYINAHEALPAYLTRIAFLDSNYNFSEEDGHGTKIAEWLAGDEERSLVVLAYDDREVELNGKKVITSDTGGTWRATERIVTALRRSMVIEEGSRGDYTRWHAPQIEMLAHRNPERKILHTALVGDRSGYIHALTVHTPHEDKVVNFDGPREWEEYIVDPPDAPVVDSNLDRKQSIQSIPPRPTDAPTGSEFIRSLEGLDRVAREEAVKEQLLAGNIPQFLRQTVPVTVEAVGLEGTRHTAVFEVMPDYLAIGSDADYVRMPMNPYTAQAFCDAFGFVLPTVKMVDAIWAAAEVKIEPQPLTEEREASATFLQHDRLIAEQVGSRATRFVAGHKKDVVISNRIQERPNRVAIYGWHYTTGKPIQPLTIVHVDWYVDYSHGVRPVRRIVEVDGSRRLSFDEILADPHLNNLLSAEGVIGKPRYELAP